jgi:hypothetical protein
MFEKASRLKLCFSTDKGFLKVEDLWELPLVSTTKVNLDDIARNLHKQLKSGDDVSFVNKEKKSDEIIQLKFDIVKHIIDVKLVENEAASLARTNREKKQKILELISMKKDEKLMGASLEDLEKMAESL